MTGVFLPNKQGQWRKNGNQKVSLQAKHGVFDEQCREGRRPSGSPAKAKGTDSDLPKIFRVLALLAAGSKNSHKSPAAPRAPCPAPRPVGIQLPPGWAAREGRRGPCPAAWGSRLFIILGTDGVRPLKASGMQRGDHAVVLGLISSRNHRSGSYHPCTRLRSPRILTNTRYFVFCFVLFCSLNGGRSDGREVIAHRGFDSCFSN